MRTVQTQNFVKILRAVFEIWTKKIKNAQKIIFSPICDPPKILFQKSVSVTFVPLWCSNFMQKIRENQWTVSEIFKDGPRTYRRTACPACPKFSAYLCVSFNVAACPCVFQILVCLFKSWRVFSNFWRAFSKFQRAFLNFWCAFSIFLHAFSKFWRAFSKFRHVFSNCRCAFSNCRCAFHIFSVPSKFSACHLNFRRAF